MFSKVFLAQTPQEMVAARPDRTAYMALHFSAYHNGLSNIPHVLPSNSILLLDDSVPPEQHAPSKVTDQLLELVERVSPTGILLDFQRPATKQLQVMAQQIVKALPCPVAITEAYAKVLGCPVFLPPPPANIALEAYIAPWKKQGVYLEIAPEGVEITVTEAGSSKKQISITAGLPLKNERLHCHYDVRVSSDRAVFSICRYKEDLAELVAEAEDLGVLGCVGLYYELAN